MSDNHANRVPLYWIVSDSRESPGNEKIPVYEEDLTDEQLRSLREFMDGVAIHGVTA